MEHNLTIFTDGGARGNPGPASLGVVIKTENGKIVEEISNFIGIATNNDAEYRGLLEALKYLAENKEKLNLNNSSKLNFYSDSNLMVNQVNGFFKIKNSRLREYLYQVRELESQIPGKIIYRIIPREKNLEADLLVNKALDNI